MIVSLRKKFIIVSAFSIMIVFMGIFLFLSASNIAQTNRILDTLTDAISSNGGEFPAFRPAERSAWSDWFVYSDVITEETRFSTRFFTVWLDQSQQIAQVNMDAIAAISKSDVEAHTPGRLPQRGTHGAGYRITDIRHPPRMRGRCLSLSTAICTGI